MEYTTTAVIRLPRAGELCHRKVDLEVPAQAALTVPTENSGWPSKVSSTSQVTMLHALVLLKPQLNFDTDVADSLAPRLR